MESGSATRTGRRRLAISLLILALGAVTEAAIAPNSLRLRSTPTDVLVEWSAGTGPYGVFRAEAPQALLDPANFRENTASTSHTESTAPLTAPVYYFAVGDALAVDPTCTFEATVTDLPIGGTTDLSWSTEFAVEVTLDGIPVSKTGIVTVSPVRTRTYQLSVTGAPATTPASCTLTVTVSPPPPCSGTQACIAWCGSGEIEDLRSGGTLPIDGRDMVHVLILPEGYTAADLDAGVFDSDVDDWLTQWQAIEPYTSFRDAFCIWKQPVVSSERVAPSSPQTADTAFRVPITPDGTGVDGDVPRTGPTAQRVWQTVAAGFPYPPSVFYPAGGVTGDIAKNLVVVILVFDERSGRSGLSGRSRRLQNPSAPTTELLSTALAHNRPHEFSHAFARLQDEYMEDCCGPLCRSIAPPFHARDITNVVCSPTCAELPWSHLLVGAPLNPTITDLVGAFGVAEVGFHPELKCLMNGRHDNARYYGGDGDLRVQRLCNFCAEVTAFRLLERTHLLPLQDSAWSDWESSWREPFFRRFGLGVPVPVPQENSDGMPIFEDCTPNLTHGLADPGPRSGRGGCMDDAP